MLGVVSLRAGVINFDTFSFYHNQAGIDPLDFSNELFLRYGVCLGLRKYRGMRPVRNDLAVERVGGIVGMLSC